MVKFSLLIGLPLLLCKSQGQSIRHIPELPIQILTRTTSIKNMQQNFISGFCTNCGAESEQCKFNLEQVKNIPQIKFTLDNITNNKYNIKTAQIKIQNVIGSYSFPKYQLKNVNMKYILYMPNTDKINGVVVYYHGSIFGMAQVPTSQNLQVQAIAALYTSNSYAVIFPNYLSYQDNDKFLNPSLLYPEVTAKASILALNNGLKTIKNKYIKMGKFDLFSVGFSQGAAYALWLQKCLQSASVCQGAQLNNAYIYKGAAGLSGPYDLEQVFKPFLTQKIKKQPNDIFKIQNQTVTNFNKPAWLTSTLLSYTRFSLGKTNYDESLNADFWKMKCSKPLPQENCKINGTQYGSIFEAVKSQKKAMQISEAISFSAFGKNYGKDKYLGSHKPAEYQQDHYNSAYGLASQELLNNKTFNQTLNNASSINNPPTKNVFLFSLKQDSIISVKNTQNYKLKHGSKVETYYFDNKKYRVCLANQGEHVEVDHNYAQVLGNLFALSYIKRVSGVDQ